MEQDRDKEERETVQQPAAGRVYKQRAGDRGLICAVELITRDN